MNHPARGKTLDSIVAHRRQVKAFDRGDWNGEMLTIARAAIERAIRDPKEVQLGHDGIAPLEQSIYEIAFRASSLALWPEIVAAYKRGAAAAGFVLPADAFLRFYSAGQFVDLLDSAGLRHLRENVQGSCWSFAARVTTEARRVVALIAAGPKA